MTAGLLDEGSKGQTALDIAQKHRFGQFDSPRRIVPDIPHWLDEVVCKCLEKKPEDRYPDAYVLSLRLQEVPKKVDLAQGVGSGTYDFENADATAETIAGTAGGAPPGDEVGGTLMRDLMKAHVEQVHAGVVGRLGSDQHPLAAAGDGGEGAEQLGEVPRTDLGRSAAGSGAGGQPEVAAQPTHGRG